MSAALGKRLVALEKRPAKQRRHDQRAWEEKVLEEEDLTREQFIAKFGSFPNYAYRKMVTPNGAPPKPIPTKNKSAAECYFAMLRGEA